VFEIPESTSRFTPGDRAAARAATGLVVIPVCCGWDISTEQGSARGARGVAAALDELPQLQLWCCFGTAPLFEEVRARIDADARLRERVHLLGRVRHEQVEMLMRAADLFVLGSHREGSSFSLIEALATDSRPW
jgi:glycosyltransferase involved in cell wall biosynthesis